MSTDQKVIVTKLRRALKSATQTYPEQLAKAVASCGYKTVHDVADGDVFKVLEATRAECGMPTAFMLAQAHAEREGMPVPTTAPNYGEFKSTAQQVQELALAYYTNTDHKGVSLIDIVPKGATVAEAMNAMGALANRWRKAGVLKQLAHRTFAKCDGPQLEVWVTS